MTRPGVPTCSWVRKQAPEYATRFRLWAEFPRSTPRMPQRLHETLSARLAQRMQHPVALWLYHWQRAGMLTVMRGARFLDAGSRICPGAYGVARMATAFVRQRPLRTPLRTTTARGASASFPARESMRRSPGPRARCTVRTLGTARARPLPSAALRSAFNPLRISGLGVARGTTKRTRRHVHRTAPRALCSHAGARAPCGCVPSSVPVA